MERTFPNVPEILTNTNRVFKKQAISKQKKRFKRVQKCSKQNI